MSSTPPKPPKRDVSQVPQKLTSSIAFFKFLQSRLSMNLINIPMPRVICRNNENPEKKILKKNFEENVFEILFTFFFLSISTTNPWHRGVYKVNGKSQLQGFKKRYGGS